MPNMCLMHAPRCRPAQRAGASPALRVSNAGRAAMHRVTAGCCAQGARGRGTPCGGRGARGGAPRQSGGAQGQIRECGCAAGVWAHAHGSKRWCACSGLLLAACAHAPPLPGLLPGLHLRQPQCIYSRRPPAPVCLAVGSFQIQGGRAHGQKRGCVEGVSARKGCGAGTAMTRGHGGHLGLLACLGARVRV